VNPRVGPAIEIGLRRFDRLKAQSLHRRPLGGPDAGFDFACPIRIADATRHRDRAVVREQIVIERIECRIVDVWREHAFF